MPNVKMISVSDSGKRYYKDVDLTQTLEGTIKVVFPYDEYLKDEIKSMDTARWNPDLRCWTVKNNRRNWFRIKYLTGENPYKPYDQTLLEFTPRIPQLYPQQYKMAQEGLTYRQTIWAAEMGLGKTLAAIEVIEHAATLFNLTRSWWVGPKSALASFDVEVGRWGMLNYPEQVMTYEGLVKLTKNWPSGLAAPQIIVFDESSRLKTLTSQRTQSAIHVVESMREEWGDDVPIILLLTGTPAPKSPLDWYSQCEIAKPGFLREGNIHKFRDRVGVVVKKENTTTGGVYPQVMSWKDSDKKCKLCGAEEEGHDFAVMGNGTEMHAFVPGVNEVAKLYKRMNGLVSVFFKKDWLSHLPDKQYRILRCKVTRSTENAMRAVAASAKSAIQALIMMRELSDGFLYQETVDGTTTCPICNGSKRVQVPIVEDFEGEFNPTVAEEVKMEVVDCSNCDGTGQIPRTIRTVDSVGCPKDDLLAEILDDHEDGRLVVYAGFTGSIDRVIETVKRKGWDYIRVDGRGWSSSFEGKQSPRQLLEIFQGKEVEKLCFIGHPGSAGMGITLTAACEIVYFSNDFNAESRIQSESRIHRPGMDINKGALITDIVHLPSDLVVLENLKKKRRLQDMSLGWFNESLKLVMNRGE